MAKVSKTDIYTYDLMISMLDYLLGTDANDNKKTKSYRVQELADLFLAYVQENADGLDQDNFFVFKDLGYTETIVIAEGESLNEDVVNEKIDFLLANNSITVTEKQLIIFKVSVVVAVYIDIDDSDTEPPIFKYIQKRKYYSILGKGTFNPLSEFIQADNLELDYKDETPRLLTEEDIESNINNVIFDLGDITGEDYLDVINTLTNPLYPDGYPLTDDTKIYYFKWIDSDITYLYYFDEENSLNSYGNYGVDGDYLFQPGELIIFYSSSINSNSIAQIYKKKSESLAYSDPTLSGSNAVIEFQPNGQSVYAFSNSGLISIDGFGSSLIIGNPTAEVPYNGKDIFIYNNKSGNLILKHDGPGIAAVKFLLENDIDLVIPPGGKVWLKYGLSHCEIIFKSWETSIDLSTKADLVGGVVPSSQLPSYVDDVLEFADLASFPATGETGKIYLALDTNSTYRWTGSVYVKIGGSQSFLVIHKNVVDSSPVTGTTSSTVVETFTIPANTIQVGDLIEFRGRIKKTGTNGGVIHQHGILGNEFFTTTSTASNLHTEVRHTAVVKSATETQFLQNTGGANPFIYEGQFPNSISSNIDWTIDQILYIRIRNISSADSTVVSYWQLARIR